MGYVIHKSTREPSHCSYSGSTWDKAGIRSCYKETYFRKDTAQMYADILSKYNLVGFKVSEAAK